MTMIEVLLSCILFALSCIFLAILAHIWITRATRKHITAYLDSLGDMIGDLLRELIESQATKTNDKTKGKGK